MKNHNIFIFKLALLFLSILGCRAQNTIIDPIIKYGTARVTGSIDGYDPLNTGIETLLIKVPHTITGTLKEYPVSINSDGSFAIDVLMETDYAMMFFMVNGYEFGYYPIMVSQYRETKIELCYLNGECSINVIGNDQMSEYDMIWWSEYYIDMHTGNHPTRTKNRSEHPFGKGHECWISHFDKILRQRYEIPDLDSTLSPVAKMTVKNEYKFFILSVVLDYEEPTKCYLQNSPDSTQKQDYIDLVRSDYDFLSKYDLNNPKNLYTIGFNKVIRMILKDSMLIPYDIGEHKIEKWLDDVKQNISDLVGFDSGVFYDMLVMNAYMLHVDVAMLPLTDIQSANIKEYFKGGDVEKILLNFNEERIEFLSHVKPVVLNDVSGVSNSMLIDNILNRYKGKVVVIDLWATWCAPCLNAMEKMHPLKVELEDRDVVFVYITSESSKKSEWNDKIKMIGGEHFYIEQSQWEYIFDKYDFEAIPTYLIFDRNGQFNHKFTSYPGNEEMKAKIHELLNK